MSTHPRYPIQLLRHRLVWTDIDSAYVHRLLKMARDEDLDGAGLAKAPAQRGDRTTRLTAGHKQPGTAGLHARTSLVVCGTHLIQPILDLYGRDCRFDPAAADGDWLDRGDPLGRVSGPAGVLLQAERVILNFLQRLSGIATLTRAYVDALGESRTALLDTRKTTPGYRVLEKYAVACGGGFNHRIGLFDRIMLKDNHLAVCGADRGERLTKAVRKARSHGEQLAIEVEVDHLDQIEPVVEAGADIILLDNFTPAELAQAVEQINHRAYTEASGGITLKTLEPLGRIGLDFISTGATVHQSVWMDIGLDWDTK